MPWQDEVFEVFKRTSVRQVCYVPDAGHARLIALSEDDAEIRAVVMTTEEEGVALAAGAWLGGQRCVVLMQSSGVGNCINMASLAITCRFPLLMLVTMRGEYGELNAWQVPMGKATRGALEAIGVTTMTASEPDEVAALVEAASVMAFDADQPIAILLSQKLLGAKRW